MKFLKSFFCLSLWAMFGFSFAYAEDTYEISVTSIPSTQDTVEESIESAPFSEEETDGTVILTVPQETIEVESPSVFFIEEETPEVPATPYQKAIIDALVYGNTLQSVLDENSSTREELLNKYPDLMEVKVTELDSDYSKNQVKADNAYQDKWLMLGGSVGVIRDSKNPEIGPSMVLNEIGKTSPSILTKFKDHEGARGILGKLEEGQITSVVCQVDDYDGSMVQMKNCEFLHPLLLELGQIGRNRMLAAIEGKGDKATNAPAAFLILLFEKALGPDNEQKCLLGPENCLFGFTALEGNSQALDAVLPEIISELKDRGYTDEMFADTDELEKEIDSFFK